MMKRLTAILLLLLGLAPYPQAATGTLFSAPWFNAFDTNGNPINNAKACFYTAGTSTLATTYSDVNLTTPNANPVRADTAGRVGPVYLTPGQSYKLVLQDATGTVGTCDGAIIRTQDNIAAIPTSSANLDVTGTAGETLTAGQAVYLSDGSGSKNAGQWYKADSAQAYSSLVPEIGIVPNSITSGASGAIRLAGQATGLTVSVGSTYYVGTAGALTTTPPVQARIVGVADSSTTLIFPKIPLPVQNWVNDFRLTLTTATPVTTADVTGASAVTLYASPYVGNRLDLPDSAGNPVRVTSAEFSIAIPATTSTMYDVYVYNNVGVATLELTAWTNDTTRATATARTNGRWFKSGDVTRMYLGSVRTTTVSGQTEDSAAKRYLWNYYYRTRKPLRVTEPANSWAYSSATWRQFNANTANQADVVIGQPEVLIQIRGMANTDNTGSGNYMGIAIGQDSTTTPMTGSIGSVSVVGTAASNNQPLVTCFVEVMPAVGRHFYPLLEADISGGGTGNFYGDNGGTNMNSGIFGWWEG